jgi:hypothetical protein
MVVDPNSKDFKRYLLAGLIDELNNLFQLSLATDMFLEKEVFDETIMDRMALILISASYLRNLARSYAPQSGRSLTKPL